MHPFFSLSLACPPPGLCFQTAARRKVLEGVAEEGALGVWHPSWPAYRSVLAQLAEGREGLLVSLAHLLDELPHLRGQRVAL